jgi:hypothetical protein
VFDAAAKTEWDHSQLEIRYQEALRAIEKGAIRANRVTAACRFVSQ